MPAINSTVLERVQGFLNRRSLPHSVVCPPKVGVTPASISSQCSTGVISMATVGPALDDQSRRFQLPAAPISRTAISSAFSFSAADTQPKQRKSDVAQTQLRACMVRSLVLPPHHPGPPAHHPSLCPDAS